MPKLTISGSLARNGSGADARARRGVQPIQALASAGPSARRSGWIGTRVKLRPQAVEIAFAGNQRSSPGSISAPLRIKNRTSNQIGLHFESDVPWLRPDPPAALLQPGGKLDVAWA